MKALMMVSNVVVQWVVLMAAMLDLSSVFQPAGEMVVVWAAPTGFLMAKHSVASRDPLKEILWVD